MKKQCKNCQKELNESQFPKRKSNKDGLHIYCNNCIKLKRKLYDDKNKKDIKKKKRAYYLKNREKILKEQKEKRIPGTRKEYMANYYRQNKEKMNNATKEYRKTDKFKEWSNIYYKDPKKRIARSMYNRVRIAVGIALKGKSTNTENLCGCTWGYLIEYIESKFKPGMSWDNYGKGMNKWSIDHIIPCSSFDLALKEEQDKCFHYTNLQPLWCSENSIKRNRI